jgi:hypothetical protein
LNRGFSFLELGPVVKDFLPPPQPSQKDATKKDDSRKKDDMKKDE